MLAILFIYFAAEMFLKPCLFLSGLCTGFPIHHFREFRQKYGEKSHLQAMYVTCDCIFWCFMEILVKRKITSTSPVETRARLCDCNFFQGCRKPPAYLKQLLCPTPMAAATGPAGLFEVVDALSKWKGRQKGCSIDSAGEER